MLPDGFFEPDGDTVVWWFYQTMSIPPGVMPSDGEASIHVVDPTNPASAFVVGPNSPTNFAGETGVVVLASGIPSLPAWGMGLTAAFLGAAAWFRLGAAQRQPRWSGGASAKGRGRGRYQDTTAGRRGGSRSR